MDFPALRLLVCPGGDRCSRDPETLVRSGYDEQAMAAAIQRARVEVNHFREILRAGEADSFAVKVPITDKHGTEHFWLAPVREEGESFIGNINNEPGIVKNVRLGQEWQVPCDEISDWMYVRGEKIHGGYTIEPLFPTMTADEVQSYKERLVR